MKKTRVLLVSAAFAVLVCTACGKKPLELTPEEQFKAVITTQVMDTTNSLAAAVSEGYNSIDFAHYGADMALSLTLSDKAAPFVHTLLATTFSNLQLDWLQSVQLTVTSSVQDGVLKAVFGVGANEVTLFTLDCIEDTEKAVIYLRLPEILHQYITLSADDLDYSLQELFSYYKKQLALWKSVPNKAVFTGVVQEVLTALLSPISEVERTTAPLTAGLDERRTVTADYTALTVQLTPDVTERMSAAVATALIESKNLRTLVEWGIQLASELQAEAGYSELSADELIAVLADAAEEAIAALSDYDEAPSLTVYADARNRLSGYKVSLPASDSTLLYAMPQKGSSFGYTLSLIEGADDASAATSDTRYALKGYGTYRFGKLTGDFTAYNADEALCSFSTKKLDIRGLQELRFNGAVSVPLTEELQELIKDEFSDLLEDARALSLLDSLSVTFTMAQKNRSAAQLNVVLRGGHVAFLTLSASSKASTGSAITLPTETVPLMARSDEETVALLRAVGLATVLDNLRKAKAPDSYVDALARFNGEALASWFEARSSADSYSEDADDDDWEADDYSWYEADDWNDDADEDDAEDADANVSDYSWLY